jgi:hypothetical protein
MLRARQSIIMSVLLPGLLAVAPVPGTAGENGESASGDDLILELHVQKQRAYLNERVPLSVVLLAGAVSVRDIRYPKLKTPTTDITDFAAPRQMNVSREGRNYGAHEFAATLTPSHAGSYRLGPVELTCDLLAPSGGASAFFGSNEPRTVKLTSESITLTVLPLPIKGRPTEFAGAVGRFTVSRTVAPTRVRQGEPFTVTTRIRGVGNIDVFSCDSIDLPGTRGYPPHAVKTQDGLNCEQTLIAETADLSIPVADISYFDPSSGRYVERRSNAVTVHVQADDISNRGADQTASQGNQVAASGNAGGATAPFWIAGATLAVLAAAVGTGMLLNRHLHRPRPTPEVEDVQAARNYLIEAEAALNTNDPEAFYLAVFRLLQIMAGRRYNLPSVGMTEGAVEARPDLPLPGEAALDPLAELFRECDAVRYGRGACDLRGMAHILERLRTLDTPDMQGSA